MHFLKSIAKHLIYMDLEKLALYMHYLLLHTLWASQEPGYYPEPVAGNVNYLSRQTVNMTFDL